MKKRWQLLLSSGSSFLLSSDLQGKKEGGKEGGREGGMKDGGKKGEREGRREGERGRGEEGWKKGGEERTNSELERGREVLFLNTEQLK